MAISSVSAIIERIEACNYMSPIAVFRVGKKGKLNAMFANTVHATNLIEDSPHYVGSFHRGMDMKQVKAKLAEAANQ